jgi:cytochrome c peroxidase
MARTVRQLALLGVTIAFATSGASGVSFSNGLGQDELGIELDGKKLLNPAPPSPPPSVIPGAFFAELFKIPTLWGIKDTTPYFHNNGAKTPRDAVAHYQRFFNFVPRRRTRWVRGLWAV